MSSQSEQPAKATPTVAPPLRQGAVAVIRDGERFLVIRRAEGITAPGAYCFPGGGLEPAESEAAAVVREIQEELGVTIVPRRRVWHSVTAWHVELFWWLVELPAGAQLVPNPSEVAAAIWLTPAEMLALPKLLASNRDFLHMLSAGNISLD